jgi:predicted Co/Zn/Cd cation transporter (cation efflux family)
MYWYALKSNMIVLLVTHYHPIKTSSMILLLSYYCLITHPSIYIYIFIDPIIVLLLAHQKINIYIYKIKDGDIILYHPSILDIYISSLLEHIHLTQRLCDRNCFEPRAQVVRVRGHSTVLGGQRLCFGVWTTERYPLVMSK